MRDFLEIFVPVILPIVSLFIGAYIQRQRDKLNLEQEAFFQKKRENYFNVISPLVLMISNGSNKREQEKIITKILSNEYRKEVLALSLYGNDEVVKSFNNLFQFIYNRNDIPDYTDIMMPLLGKILLEMRKELGNKSTSLDEYGILEFLIKDIKEVKIKSIKDYNNYLKNNS
ncbi:hypothetical protein SAMN04489724_2728 [Algoriphagus locisalis]|uniref:Uncharacterized protein n=1 Tax=Algoriphagus locisalis TaxID=305507 RepID=A0A1I7BUL4_9BACT|nr:hypothetical protein [Algoriphagus locisalis]SFT90853.1 hypothetical protein SAMN04489724_2728 [Algoriphagus locisalis]